MMAQNMTKFSLVMVLLGIAFTIAVFRPPPFDAPPISASIGPTLPEHELVAGDKDAPDDEHLPAIQAEQDRLAQEWEEFYAEQDRLARESEALQAKRVHLDDEQARLQEKETALRAKEASLAEWEKEVQRLHRFSVVALIVSSLMGVPAIVFLIVLVRQGPRTPDEVTKQAPQPDEGEQTVRYRVVPSQVHGGNGRSKEAVKHYL